jgi:hypothetical protein
MDAYLAHQDLARLKHAAQLREAAQRYGLRETLPIAPAPKLPRLRWRRRLTATPA